MKKTISLIYICAFLFNHIASAGPAKKNSESARFPAEAPKYPTYVEECKKAATEKLREIAKFNNFILDENTITVSNVDDRWYNPCKYVWFSASVKKSDGSSEIISTLTQKSFFPAKACF